MKKLMYVFVFCLLSISVISCNKKPITNETVVSAESVGQTNYIDITTKVKNAKSEYQPLYDFGLKHGLLYSNGEQTKGVPVMEEITPLNVGDKVQEKKKETVSDIEYKATYYETDVDILYNTIKDFTKDEVYDYLQNVNSLYTREPYGESIEDEIDYINCLLYNMGYDENGTGVITLDELNSMTDDEFKNHVAKVLSYSNIVRNEYEKSFVDYVEERNSNKEEVLVDDYLERDSEYQKWYTENIEIIGNIRGMDFTKEVLPDGVIFKDDKYYLDKSIIKPDENGMVTFIVYGQTISLNAL